MSGGGVDVAQTPIETAPRVDGRGTAGGVHEIDGLDGIRHGLRNGEPIDGALIGRGTIAAGNGVPHVGGGLAHIAPARPDERLGLRHLRLDRRPRGELAFTRHPRGLLAAGETDELLDGDARDGKAEGRVGDVGPTHELIERLRAMGVDDRAVHQRLRDEEVGHRVVMAPRPAHPGGGPCVDDLGVGGRQHTLQIHRAALGPRARAIAIPQVTAHVEPPRDQDVAALAPPSGEAVAAGRGDGAAARGRRAAHDRAPGRRKQRRQHLVAKRAGRARHRAGRDQHAPAHRAVRPRQLLDHVEVRQRIDFAAAERARQEHPVEAGIRQRLHDRLGERPAALDLVGRGADARR